MWASFKYSLLQLVRVPGVLIWTLVFPIVLGSLFVMMLGALDERAEAVSVNVVVVDEEQAKGEGRGVAGEGPRAHRSLLREHRISSASRRSGWKRLRRRSVRRAGVRYLHGSAR
ncbi:putative uncharacterized protein [Eggerthella sp. CAG:298]|nr:putative uncharacterized protein [Eggerthella sp. CAG:298]